MQVGVIGINYKSSHLELREKLARVFQKEFGSADCSDFILLSTCNRTELYFTSRSLADTHIELLKRLRNHIGESFEHALYAYFRRDCFNHLGRVISGMDSAILGESDIQRQVKLAYEKQRLKTQLTYDLHYLFQKGLKIGKEMRTSFLIGKKGSQLPHAIQSVVEWQNYDIKEIKLLFVGNSSVNRKLMTFFEHKGCQNISLCTRGDLEKKSSISMMDWKGLKNWDTFDVIICATYHEEYMIKRSAKDINKTLIFDLSVPRNVDPSLAKHPQLFLYNIDEIGQIIQKKRGEKEIALCEDAIEKAVHRQIHLFKERRQAKWKYANASAF